MKNTNLNLKIRRLPYTRLLKSEMADYVENTIAIVENSEIESELITPLLEELSAKESDIELLRISYGIDVERLRVYDLKMKMMLVISAFKVKVRLLSKSNPELDMHVLQNAINKHLRKLDKCRNDKELSQKIAGFFDLRESNLELQTALTDLEITKEADAMLDAYSQVEAALKKKVRVLSQRPEIATKDIVKDMNKTLDNLYKSIEVAHMLTVVGDAPEEGEVLDLTPLIDELNQLANMYALSISIRNANNKRKADKDKEGQEGGENAGEGDEGGEGDGDPITTAMCFGDDGISIDNGYLIDNGQLTVDNENSIES